MAVLTGPEIHRQVNEGNIVIRPFDPKLLGPNSYDLHLGDKLLVYGGYVLGGMTIISKDQHVHVQDPTTLEKVYAIDSRSPPDAIEAPMLPDGGWLLVPGKLYIGSTVEYTETRGYMPRIDGRSSLGRIGVFCHITAGQGDNGFKGTWTLELAVVEPVILYPGDRLFQILYETLEGDQTFYGETDNSSGRYQDQENPTPTRIHKCQE